MFVALYIRGMVTKATSPTVYVYVGREDGRRPGSDSIYGLPYGRSFHEKRSIRIETLHNNYTFLSKKSR